MAYPFFDTNIIIDWLFARPQAVNELSLYGRHRISRIVWTEILAGEPIESREHVRQLIAPFEIIELDGRIAAAAAELRYRRRMKLLDAMILATAQVGGGVLITRNAKDFPADMPGIRVPYTI